MTAHHTAGRSAARRRGLGRVAGALLFYALLLQRGARGTAAARAGIARGYRWYWACAQASGVLRIESGGLDALRAEPGGLLIAANHPTMLDAMVLVARLPRSVCIMKAELMRN